MILNWEMTMKRPRKQELQYTNQTSGIDCDEIKFVILILEAWLLCQRDNSGPAQPCSLLSKHWRPKSDGLTEAVARALSQEMSLEQFDLVDAAVSGLPRLLSLTIRREYLRGGPPRSKARSLGLTPSQYAEVLQAAHWRLYRSLQPDIDRWRRLQF